MDKAWKRDWTPPGRWLPPAKHKTREAWLLAAVDWLRPHFIRAGKPLGKVRVALGLTGANVLGCCYADNISADATREIFISPIRDGSDALFVLETLTHELCHAALPHGDGHKKPWQDLAREMRLTFGPGGSFNGVTDQFRDFAEPLLEHLGPLPHARMALYGGGFGFGMGGDLPFGIGRCGGTKVKKPDHNRQLKCHCETCGYIARTTRGWIDKAGTPHCPDHGAMVEG